MVLPKNRPCHRSPQLAHLGTILFEVSALTPSFSSRKTCPSLSQLKPSSPRAPMDATIAARGRPPSTPLSHIQSHQNETPSRSSLSIPSASRTKARSTILAKFWRAAAVGTGGASVDALFNHVPSSSTSFSLAETSPQIIKPTSPTAK